jgi:hypothetical protein
VRANTVGARIDGTVVVIAAIHWSELTSLGGVARIDRARVVVVADGGRADTFSAGTRTDGTEVTGGAVHFNVRTTARGRAGATHGVDSTRIAIVTI